jgi:hypothetical protein
MPKLKDLTTKRFGRLVVISRAPNRAGRTYWNCECDCGNKSVANAYNLGHKDYQRRIQSCGCFRRERQVEANITHGLSHTAAFPLWCDAKRRAKRFSVPFSIEVCDVIIPDICPLLGIKLVKGDDVASDASPSLDRIVPENGYVRGNVWGISYRANAIKRNATFTEFERIYMAWKSMEEQRC